MFPALRGVGRYTLSLIRSIIDTGHTHGLCIFYNTFKKKNGYYHFPIDGLVETSVSGLPGRLLTGLWNRYSFPSIDFFVGSHDVFHAPTAHLIPPTKGRLVCTIHDLIPRLFPDNCSSAFLQNYNRSMELVCERADAIITVSESTKSDIVSIMNYDPDRISVIPLAAALEKIENPPSIDKETVIKKYGLNRPYLLYVGGGEAYKNLDTLINVFRVLRAEFQIPHKLLLVGKILECSPNLEAIVAKYNLEKDVVFTGIVSNQELIDIYQMADIFVFLSLYEGFGLVLLEAMEFGLPIVASNVSSIPEVVGDGAILVDPKNIENISKAIMSLIDCSDLAKYYSKKGLKRASQFSWDLTATQTIKVYQSLIK